MNYRLADKLLQGRCRESRKLENNTYLQRRGDNIAVKLHNTDVVTFAPNGDVVLDSGGWLTSTTKDRMNKYLPGPGGGSAHVWQKNGRWFCGDVAYADGMVIHADGTVTGYGEVVSVSVDKAFKRRVSAYAKLCADSLPVDPPGPGDCWYCCMTTDDGKSLGEKVGDTRHLESHMTEGYVVPSLVYNALCSCGFKPERNIQFAEAFGATGSSWGLACTRIDVHRCVYRYILKQYGFAV